MPQMPEFRYIKEYLHFRGLEGVEHRNAGKGALYQNISAASHVLNIDS
jgi:hypothetical protein